MSILLTTGFEVAVGTGFTGSNGSPSQDAVVFLSGSKSGKFTANATYPYEFLTYSAANVAYAKGYIYLTSLPASNTVCLDTAGSLNTPQLQISTGGVLRAQFSDGTGQNGPTLSTATWYGFEMEADCHANPNIINWRTFAAGTWTTQTQASLAQAAQTLTGTYIGIVAVGPTSTYIVNFDDVSLGSSATAGTDYLPIGSASRDPFGSMGFFGI